MKKVILVLLMIVTLVGCNSNDSNMSKYGDINRKGKITDISYNQYQKKVKQKQSFLVIFEQEGCNYCKKYNKELKKFIKDHHVNLYVVNFSKEKEPQKIWDLVSKHVKEKMKDNKKLKEFLGTPHTLVYRKGKLIFSESGLVSEEDLNNLISDEELYIIDKNKRSN